MDITEDVHNSNILNYNIKKENKVRNNDESIFDIKIERIKNLIYQFENNIQNNKDFNIKESNFDTKIESMEKDSNINLKNNFENTINKEKEIYLFLNE